MRWYPEPWSGEAASSLGPALGDDADELQQQVEQGAATLWRIPGHGYLITRLESIADRRELVLVAWAGVDTGPLVKHAQAVCVAQGIETIRFHTAHDERLISRFVKKWGFARVETLYRWSA